MNAAPALPHKAPMGLVICSMAQFLLGLAFLLVGILFLVAPERLRDTGFRQDAALVVRLAALLIVGGVGALFVWNAWGLIRLRAFALDKTRALALATAGTFAARIAFGGAGSAVNWLIVVVALAIAGYLSLPSVRALFRTPR